jgi:CheY-like chemotaxis protein
MTADKKTILVVDDEPDTRAFLTTLLEDNGFETITASNGQEALASVEKSLPDMISLDVTMPEKSGVRLYRELRENDAYKDIPIVIVTGVSGEFERFISTRSQVPPPDGYVPKPIDQARYVQLAKELTS